MQLINNSAVSVPLRGLDMRKLPQRYNADILKQRVSVPLRGLDMRKHLPAIGSNSNKPCFSPLAGIRYAETANLLLKEAQKEMFQSPCGD